MRASLGVVLPGLAAALVGACFDFEATMAGGPLDDAGNPPADATVAEGSSSGGDAQGEGSDAPVGTADAGGGDTGGGGGPDGASYCASIAPDGGLFFCDDFDEHPLPGSWSTWREISGSIEESDASAKSPPNSADEKTAMLALGQAVDVSLRTPLGAPSVPATLRFGFSLDPVQIDPTVNAAIVLGAVDFLDGAGDRYSVELVIDVESGAPALALDEQSGFADGGSAYLHHPLPPAQPLTLNAWTDLVIEIDWTAPGTAQGIVTVNGAQEIALPLTMTVTPTSLQIGIGTSYVSEPAPEWELRYDNVRFTAR
jgi:hypothetical protein